MDILNDDCQLLIVKFLDLTDQLNLFEANREESTSRLNSNLSYTWQHQLIFTLETEHFKYFDKKPQLLHDFLSIISPKVQQLELNDVTLNRLKRWEQYKFPEMRILEYSLAQHKDINPIIQLLAEIFPKLVSLRPYGSFDLIHIGNWKHLRKLDMIDCRPVSQSDESFKGIEGLQMLEVLRIRTGRLYDEHFKMLVLLPKLQTLTIRDNRQHLRWIIDGRAKNIEKITLNRFFLNELCLVKKLINLHQVTIENAKGIGITGLDLQECITSLSHLERLDIIGFEIFRSEIEFWDTIASCPSLRILNISFLNLNEDFFSSNRRPMEMVLEKRSSPFILNYSDTGENERLIRSYFNHPNLKISQVPLKFDETFFVQFDFYPCE